MWRSPLIRAWSSDRRVEDTGPGISEEAWPNLFRPFASFGKKNGLGLGLALSRQSLLDIGGDLWVRRNRPVEHVS